MYRTGEVMKQILHEVTSNVKTQNICVSD